MTELPLNAWLVPLAAALAAAGLAVFVLVRPWAESFHRRVAFVLGLSALVEAAGAALLFVPSDAIVLRKAALSFEFLRMAALYLAAAALIGRSAREADPTTQTRSWIATVVAVLGVAGSWWGGFAGIDEMAEGAGLVRVGPAGHPLHVALLVGLVLALAQLESVLRASRDPERYRIKFAILGLCALAGFELYVVSQTLLIGAWRVHHAFLSGIATLVSVALIALGFGRMRLVRTIGRVSVSSQALYGSLTLLGVGLYLLGVGLLGQALRLSGRTLNVGVAELAVFVVTLVLVAGFSSRAARARVRDTITRHLLRSRHDYRTKWLEVTDAFRGTESGEQVLDRLLDLLARTFAAPRLSIFMRYEADDRFHQVRTINIEGPPAPIARDHAVAAAMARSDEPLELPPPGAPHGDAFLEATRAALGVPLRGAGELMGFVTLSAAPRGTGYDVDDRDLLRAIAHHAGVLLAHSRLAEERHASAELDALNRFAAFYLHDFKNLAARLSLVVQNAGKYGDDPAFRAEAMKIVARTSEQMGELLAQLSRRSPAHGRIAPLDIEALVDATIRSLGPDAGVRLSVEGEPGQVLAVPEQLQQVVLNLVLNAKRAVEHSRSGAAIDLTLRGDENGVRLEVADTGGGIPAERMRTLFQPFQSETVGSFGIGLYESKRIVESYRGTLRVESEVGRGTRVVVELPAVAGQGAVMQTSIAAKENTP